MSPSVSQNFSGAVHPPSARTRLIVAVIATYLGGLLPWGLATVAAQPPAGSDAGGASDGAGSEAGGGTDDGAEIGPGGDEIPPPNGADTSPDAPVVPDEGAAPLQLIVVDAAPYGIDEVVGRHVSAQMRETGAALGYGVLSPEQTVAAAQRLRMPYPPTPADLWRVTYFSESQRGAFARVWASSGRYVVELSVASLDGTGPFFARGTAGAEDLRSVVDGLLRQALPPPGAWRGRVEPGAEDDPSDRPRSAASPDRLARPPTEAERPEPEVPVTRRFQLALQSESAFGASQDSYYNHLLGLRVDFRASHSVLFGVYAGYANLRGKAGRAQNILSYLQVEDRVRVNPTSDFTIPLRLGLGYLPYNGPVVRLSAGLNYAFAEQFEIGIDLLTPTFWILPDRTAVSLDVALELVYRP